MRWHRRIGAITLGVLSVAALLVPSAALAQDYDLNFTLPTAGKSGCMVCHGDKNLGRLQGNQYISYWVDERVLDEGAHASIMCTGCHLDFAYMAPHDAEQDDWVRTARLACKNCHQDQWTEYSAGAHSLAAEPGRELSEEDQRKPACGDCHRPAHEIEMLTDNPQARARLHLQGFEVCGQCHPDEWESYVDYYHGAAYRRGAKDAPSCWDCHGYHNILPSSNRDSLVHSANLRETCGQDGCHNDPDDRYLSYAGLVHRRDEVRADNPLYRFMDTTRESIQGIFGTIRSWFT